MLVSSVMLHSCQFFLLIFKDMLPNLPQHHNNVIIWTQTEHMTRLPHTPLDWTGAPLAVFHISCTFCTLSSLHYTFRHQTYSLTIHLTHTSSVSYLDRCPHLRWWWNSAMLISFIHGWRVTAVHWEFNTWTTFWNRSTLLRRDGFHLKAYGSYLMALCIGLALRFCLLRILCEANRSVRWNLSCYFIGSNFKIVAFSVFVRWQFGILVTKDV